MLNRPPRRATRATRVVPPLLAAALALWVAASGCARRATAPAPAGRILVIGMDGAEWSLIKPMMAAGELPNLKKLMDRGVYGNLRSIEPLAKSPAIWTTIATGKPPEEHGVKSFVDTRGNRPLTQNVRRVKAVWNILSAAGRSVGIIGWLVTWPAEKVNGFVVSDYIQYQASRTTPLEGRTYPPELYNEIADLNRDWRAMPWSEVNSFLSKPIPESTADSSLIFKARPIQWMITADATFADIAMKLGGERKPDFLAVYFRSSDTMGHLFWNYIAPESHPANLTEPALIPYFKETMRRDYAWIDSQIGRVLSLADDRTTVIVCSDHGFVGGGGGGVKDHNVMGVLIMAGPHITRGEITGATVYDVTPTILALSGLPRAEDMPGKVLWSAFDSTIRPEMFHEKLPTYETGPAGTTGEPVSSPVDKELMERLKTLGYIK